MGNLLFGRLASKSGSMLHTVMERGVHDLGSVIVPPHQYSYNELKALRAVALAGASLSLLSGMVVMFWFINMRRSFRHHLIMLLILSDSFKAMWQFVFPVVALFMGGVKSADPFCTATGFLLSIGIEASDFAVLMIAIHSALSIFYPRSGLPGRAGLYRFRYAIYVLWIIFPVTMASLAFLNKSTPYSSQNTFCYLPVRPFWYRLALAWIPRYIIMLTITILYASIYIYVRWKFHSYRTDFGFSAGELEESEFSRDRDEKRRSSLHNMLPKLRWGSSGSYSKDKRVSIADTPFSGFARAFSFNERPHTDVSGANPQHSTVDPKDEGKGTVPQNNVSIPPPTYQPRLSGSPPQTALAQSDGSGSDRRSMESPTTPEDTLDESAARERRRRQLTVQRQLRFLFIYPLVYVMIWIVPFIGHVLQYSSSYARNPSFPLTMIVAIAVPLQGFIDCALFTTREKPWRYMPVTDQRPWYSKLLGLQWQPAHIAKFTVVGTTAESRRAYERRARERKEYEQEVKDREVEQKNNRLSRKHSMSWWDSVETARVNSAQSSNPNLVSDGGQESSSSGASRKKGSKSKGDDDEKPSKGSLRGASPSSLRSLRPSLKRDKSSSEANVPTISESREEK